MAQSLANNQTSDLYVAPVAKTWTNTGTTNVVTDDNIVSTSFVGIMNTSAFNGRWYVSNITPSSTVAGVLTPGTFTITSSSSETATTTTLSYQLI